MTINSYCCVCERETPHQEVDDDVFFEFALMCLICYTVWEAEEQAVTNKTEELQKELDRLYPIDPRD